MFLALLISTRENLCFNCEAIERVSGWRGWRRHRSAYTDIKPIKLKSPSRNRQVAAILIGTSRLSAPTKILLYNDAPGESKKMLFILSGQTQALSATRWRVLLDFHTPSTMSFSQFALRKSGPRPREVRGVVQNQARLGILPENPV